MTTKNEILEILENVISDFNEKWCSGSEQQCGLEEYAEQIEEILTKQSKKGYSAGSTDAHKLLLKTLYNQIEVNCSEHIISGGLRFYGVSSERIKHIFEAFGHKIEPKF